MTPSRALRIMRRTAAASGSAVFLAALLLFLTRHAQYVRFSLDEHQFVAAGALLARRGLWPFLDYPYYHLPNLPLLYALVFLFTDQLLAAARALSGAAAWVCMAVVFITTMKRMAALQWPWRLLLAAAAVLMVMATPLFALTSGKAWNQDPALAAAMLALVALWHAAASRRHPGAWGLACGALLGLAIGTRVTYAPLLVGFLLLIPLMPRNKDARLQTMGGVLGGGCVTLLPTLAAWLADPATFWYGVLEFPLTNVLAERADTVVAKVITHRAIDLDDKLPFIVECLSHRPTQAVLAAVALLALPATTMAWCRRGPGAFALRSASLTALLIALGAVAPLPMYSHYLYPALPPLVLCAVLGAALLRRRLPAAARRTPALALGAAAVAAIATGMPMLTDMATTLRDAPPTVPQRLAAWSDELAAATPAQRVLTLAPIIALEAGCDVYEHTAAGAVPYRAAMFVPPARREPLHLLGPDNLDVILADDPPPAILTGVTVFPHWEEAMESYAREHRYTRVPLGGRRVLWLTPGESAAAMAEPHDAPLH